MKNLLTLFLLVLTLCGCGSELKVPPTAEHVAIAFFDAIYNQKDVNKAATFCTLNLTKKIQKYVTAKNVARRLFNMSFDSVKIDVALGDLKVREEFKSSGKLTILFTGSRQNQVFKELKAIKLIKKDNAWLVEQILADPIRN